MKLYIYRSYNLAGDMVDQGYFYAKSRDTMRARIAREQMYHETSVSETSEPPSQLMGANGKPVKGGIKLKDSPQYIGKVLSLQTVPPTWTSADGTARTFNRNTGKLYARRH